MYFCIKYFWIVDYYMSTLKYCGFTFKQNYGNLMKFKMLLVSLYNLYTMPWYFIQSSFSERAFKQIKQIESNGV